MYIQMHQNDREQMARQLYLSLEQFDRLLASANYAHEILKKLGPFYGKEEIEEPTFRITADPVHLPIESKDLVYGLGNDLLHMGKALQKIPEKYKSLLGEGLDYRIPLSWRIDAIIDTNEKILLNEIEGIDSVSALMMAEQLAYHLQPLEETTIARFITAINNIYPAPHTTPLLIAIVRTDLANNPFTLNAKRFIEFLRELSKETIDCHLYDIEELKNGVVKPDWSQYTAIMNEAYCSLDELQALGIQYQQLLNAGNYNAMTNKGAFALLHEVDLEKFWVTEIGKDRYEKLKAQLIPTTFIRSLEDLKKAREEGKTAKVNWAYGNSIIINRAKGVAIPYGDIEESGDEKWKTMEDYFNMGYKMIAQDFIEPAKIFAFLRKKGTNLEPIDWYNRLCIKYVASGNPNAPIAPDVHLTAMEVTLGPEVIPAGRRCAFTAGTFA